MLFTGKTRWVPVACAAAIVVATVGFRGASGAQMPRELLPFNNGAGDVLTMTTAADFDTSNPFFQSLGTNGRACVTCHQPADGWSMTPAHVRQRFEATRGEDPLFRSNDGSICSTADVSTVAARKTAYAMLLSKGLIRVGMPLPANADFALVNIDDPYNCASASELSLFRRPLPATNLRFLTAVMWDGRESHPGYTLAENLASQAMDATLGHAQAAVSPSEEQLQRIVDFESSLFTAQSRDNRAGGLGRDGGNGGPSALTTQPFFAGINDPLGGNPTGAAFDPAVFSIFSAWMTGAGTSQSDGLAAARRAIARGEEIFNTRPIAITGVIGLNDALGAPVVTGTCTTCHDTPNVGNHSVPLAINIGVSDESRRTPDLPLYTFQCNATGAIVRTTDPGRALITGKCADIGKTKGPILRALASRPPYFHNGSAATLGDAVDFYDQRFHLGLTPQEKADLVAFLNSL